MKIRFYHPFFCTQYFSIVRGVNKKNHDKIIIFFLVKSVFSRFYIFLISPYKCQKRSPNMISNDQNISNEILREKKNLSL